MKPEIKETLARLGLACAMEFRKTRNHEFALVSGIITTVLQVWEAGDMAGNPEKELQELVGVLKEHCRTKLSPEGKARVKEAESRIEKAKKAGLN